MSEQVSLGGRGGEKGEGGRGRERGGGGMCVFACFRERGRGEREGGETLACYFDHIVANSLRPTLLSQWV